tara:strand:+ start:1039 stop:1203 length:165 start_codon:yes stop_codon:yes gene_type:complete
MAKKWGWYTIIYSLANEDLLKIDEVVKKPLYECLTFMSHKQDIEEAKNVNIKND